MMKTTIAAAMIMLCTQSALALDLSPTNAGRSFEKAAASLENPDIKVQSEECTAAENTYTCRFSLGKGVEFLARAPYDTDQVTGLGLYFTGGSDLANSAGVVAALLKTLDKDISLVERNRIVAKLLGGLSKEMVVEIGPNYVVTAEYDASVGVRILAEPN